jgi:hypothetical protein
VPFIHSELISGIAMMLLMSPLVITNIVILPSIIVSVVPASMMMFMWVYISNIVLHLHHYTYFILCVEGDVKNTINFKVIEYQKFI